MATYVNSFSQEMSFPIIRFQMAMPYIFPIVVKSQKLGMAGLGLVIMLFATTLPRLISMVHHTFSFYDIS